MGDITGHLISVWRLRAAATVTVYSAAGWGKELLQGLLEIAITDRSAGRPLAALPQ